ncbi:hypothetical protein ACGFSI_34725 [Streptomyces virginiae]|uniref:hypothetical protein n=1 Tax=Streptomyces virginiae TaxID=1961 RepID=UPI00371136B8
MSTSTSPPGSTSAPSTPASRTSNSSPSWLTDQECRYLGSGPGDTAALLLRNGFLVPSRRQARPSAARLRAEIGTGTESRDGTRYVSNPVTGVTILLRGTAVDTWQDWQDGVTPASTDEAVTEALVRYGFLHREPVGAGQTQPRYLTQGQAV